MGDSDTVLNGNVYIKVVRADDLRTHLNREPAPMAMLRVSVAGVAQPELMKTSPMASTTSPEWGEEFKLPVTDASQCQLECTIWDTSDPQPSEFSNFLGEVLLNLAKLIPYKGHYIEQVFFVKQGKTIKTDQQATGNLKLGLRLDISEQPRVGAPVSAPARGIDSEKEQAQEEARRQQEEEEDRRREEEEDEEERRREEEEDEEDRIRAEQAEQQRRAAMQKKAAEQLARDREIEAAEQAEAEAKRQEEMMRAERQREMQEQIQARQMAQQPPSGGGNDGLTVTVVSAQHLPKTDMLGSIDPYVQLDVGGTVLKTEVIKKNTDPRWNEDFRFERVRQGEYLTVRVIDWDRMTKNDPVGEARVPLDGYNGQHTVPLMNSKGQPVIGKDKSPAEVTLRLVFDGATVEKVQRPVEQPPPAPVRAAPTPQMTPSRATDTSAVGSSRTRIVIAVIEASNLAQGSDGGCDPVSVISLEGPISQSKQQTKPLNKTRDPFWNEKFVFGVEESHMDSSTIHAEVVSHGQSLGAVAPIPVKTLLKGQRMSLPTINNGADIFCVDGWFNLDQTQILNSSGASPTKIAGRSQLHLRMTYIPSPSSDQSYTPTPVRATRDVSPEPTPVRATPQVLHHMVTPLSNKRPILAQGGVADVGLALMPDAAPTGAVVQGVVPGGPAAKTGQIRPGDVIIDVDGTDVAGMTPEHVQGMLQGPPHSPVTIIYQRSNGSDPLVITLLRSVTNPDATPIKHVEVSHRMSNSPAPVPVAHSLSPPGSAPVHVQYHSDPVSSDDTVGVLREEFGSLAFLWGEPQRDPGVAALMEWKDELLYAPVHIQPVIPSPAYARSSRGTDREVIA